MRKNRSARARAGKSSAARGVRDASRSRFQAREAISRLPLIALPSPEIIQTARDEHPWNCDDPRLSSRLRGGSARRAKLQEGGQAGNRVEILAAFDQTD